MLKMGLRKVEERRDAISAKNLFLYERSLWNG